MQSGVFLGKLLGPLLKVGLPLMKNVLKPLQKSVLIPIGLTAVTLALDVGFNRMAILVILNEKMEDIMKAIKPLEESGLLIKGASETIENKAKEQKGGFVGILLGTLGAGLLGNLLASTEVIRFGEETIRAGHNFSATTSFG